MSNHLPAADPLANVAVHASAGTGKTWLLVTRILRLLLSGAPQKGILALTFTRKAAAEIQHRVTQSLREFACADENALDEQLLRIGLTPDKALRNKAQLLFEHLLFSEQPLRTTTFHAFCQELLQRFPLEASIPPGFELLEASGTLEQEAFDALYAEATQNTAGPVARALENMFDACGGLHNVQLALRSFLSHRSDWWAYTAHQDALGYATKKLTELLAINPNTDPELEFLTQEHYSLLDEFRELLDQHPTKTNKGHVDALIAASGNKCAVLDKLHLVRTVFLTKSGEPRARKAGPTLEKRLGSVGQQRLIELHDTFCALLADLKEKTARRASWHLSHAWFIAGNRLIDHYQRLKRERRVLDFADLEWHAFCLLTASDNAQWVQYKLDARIDHLLVDEFQDTNPTQWRLLLPLMEELAATKHERARSIFIVGDNKQSIYRFRRADPELLVTASDWIVNRLEARTETLSGSRRSALAIMTCVNHVFGSAHGKPLFPDFVAHTSYLADLWGRVELLPLVCAAAAQETSPRQQLRNPLQEPRQIPEDLRYQEEGRVIADRILSLLDSKTLLGEGKDARPVRAGDIMILMRQRTHAPFYEHALREAGILYLGATRGALLDCLEIRDMEALLNTLITPYNNLTLAHVLRSPVFAVTDEHLLQLASSSGGVWFERLQSLAQELAPEHPLSRAYRHLSAWRKLAGQLPVHDLLDQIFHSANVFARYESAFPESSRTRVLSNLTQFLELALDVDSGRYPSLPNFLNRLQLLRNSGQDAPDEIPALSNSDSHVRMLTIHGAKGLESPVVFLADAGARYQQKQAHKALIDWPSNNERPEYFLLTARKDNRDSISTALMEKQQGAETREDLNLLYVALTRAKQLLIISGSQARQGSSESWYELIQRQFLANDVPSENNVQLISSGLVPSRSVTIPKVVATTCVPDAALSTPLPIKKQRANISPSHAENNTDKYNEFDTDASQRGEIIHQFLEYLTSTRPMQKDHRISQIANQYGRDPADPELQQWWTEAYNIWSDPKHSSLFQANQYLKAYSEAPLHYTSNGATVHGVIDRLIEYKDHALVIDYKTNIHANSSNAADLARDFAPQLEFYVKGVEKIFPGKPVHACILFTSCNELVRVEPLLP